MDIRRGRRPAKAKKNTPEDDAQIAVIKWAKMARLPFRHQGKFVADYLIHIPNGGQRHIATAAKLKAMGVKPGVSDLFLPVAVGESAGLWIELKAAYTNSKDKNYPTPAQREWLDKMRAQGYRAEVCWGAVEAIAAIREYIGGEHDAERLGTRNSGGNRDT